MEDNAKQCKVNGLVPLGYKKGEDGRYAIDEVSAQIVREIFRRVAANESLASIADDLNNRGILTASKRPWGKNSFSALLSNERYVGVYKFGDVRVENGIPSIISSALFAQVEVVGGRRLEVAGRRREFSDS